MKDMRSAPPTLVCELANSHAGDEEHLRALIRAYAELDYPNKALKFQVLRADTIALPDFEWYPVYEELAFDEQTWATMITAAAAEGDVWIDVFDRYGVEVVQQNLDRVAGVKLQASVLDNEEVCTALEMTDLSGKRLMVNVSGFDLNDVHRVVERLSRLTPTLILQIGFQSYPTKIEDTALQKLAPLRAAFPRLELAMADHAAGGSDFAQLAPLLAAIGGCRFIEKHFALDRDGAKYDGFSALEPPEMQQLCTRLLELERGRSGPFVSDAEATYLAKSIQVPVLRRASTAGARLDPDDLLFRRTAQTGLTWPALQRLQRGRQRVKGDLTPHSTLVEDDFAPARVAAIVACRMKSSRLAKKATLPIGGVSSVERCLHQCLAIQGVDRVVLATSDVEEDQVLNDHRCDGRADFWAGDPDDVIARYLGACEHYGVDVIVRVTADCPVVSTELLEHLLEEHFNSGADYTAAAEASVGTAGEIIEVSALRKIIDVLGRAPHSEYMTWYFRNNPDVFRLRIVDLPPAMVRGYRLTLDHPEDLEVFSALVDELGPERRHYPLHEVFAVLDQAPAIAAKNAHIALKYVADQDLIAMLNEKTRLPPEVRTLRGAGE